MIFAMKMCSLLFSLAFQFPPKNVQLIAIADDKNIISRQIEINRDLYRRLLYHKIEEQHSRLMKMGTTKL